MTSLPSLLKWPACGRFVCDRCCYSRGDFNFLFILLLHFPPPPPLLLSIPRLLLLLPQYKLSLSCRRLINK